MRRLPVLVIAVLALITGCSSSSSKNGTQAGGSGPTFALTEFSVKLQDTAPSGDVQVTVENKGGETHELVLVRAGSVKDLPTKADGSVDEDKINEGAKLGETGDIPAGQSVTKTFSFTPGTYIAFCNLVDSMMMSGGGMTSGGGMNHVHFAQGMYTSFTVS
jgi:hypothetical protein